MPSATASRSVRSAAIVWGLLALAGCAALDRLLAPGAGPAKGVPSPDGQPPKTDYTVSYRVGLTWEDHDDRLEIYERRRLVWLDVRDAAGRPPPSPPVVSVSAPAGLETPKAFDAEADASGRYKVRVRFYEPGAGYGLHVQIRRPGAEPEAHAIDLPPVRPGLEFAGDLGVEYTAVPPLGRPHVPVRLELRARTSQGLASEFPVTPTVKVINPCGWGPSGTCSVVPGDVGAYAWEIPKEEVVEFIGIYKIKVFPLADPATFVEYRYETRDP